MSNPSTDFPVYSRIQELARVVVDEQMKQAKNEPGHAMLCKLMGASDADVAESMLKQPEVQIAAIMAYLEELAAKGSR